MTTVGYGDILAKSNEEKVTATIIMLLGATVFGYVLATVAALVGSVNASDAKSTERMSMIKEYLNDKNVPGKVKDAVLKHFKYLLNQTSAFDENQILGRLPLTISREILYFSHLDTMQKISLFQFISHRGISLYIFRNMTPALFDKGQTILRKGDDPSEIIFIIRGTAGICTKKERCSRETVSSMSNTYDIKEEEDEYGEFEEKKGSERNRNQLTDFSITDHEEETYHDENSDDEEEEQATKSEFNPGNFIGHIALISGIPHQKSIVARTTCSVYTLSRLDISKIVSEYPMVALQIQKALASAIYHQNTCFLKTKHTANNMGLLEHLRSIEKRENVPFNKSFNSTSSSLDISSIDSSTSHHQLKSKIKSGMNQFFNKLKRSSIVAPIDTSPDLLSEELEENRSQSQSEGKVSSNSGKGWKAVKKRVVHAQVISALESTDVNSLQEKKDIIQKEIDELKEEEKSKIHSKSLERTSSLLDRLEMFRKKNEMIEEKISSLEESKQGNYLTAFKSLLSPDNPYNQSQITRARIHLEGLIDKELKEDQTTNLWKNVQQKRRRHSDSQIDQLGDMADNTNHFDANTNVLQRRHSFSSTTRNR